MPAPVYFFADATQELLFPGGRPDAAQLERYGVAEAWADVRPTNLEEFKQLVAAVEYRESVGPGGRNGLMTTVDRPGGTLANAYGSVRPEQTWLELIPERTWVHLDRVTPADLLRFGPRRSYARQGVVAPRVRGYDTELADGHTWHVPLVRTPRAALEVKPFSAGRDLDRTCLPRSSGFDGRGQLVRRVNPAYAGLWEAYRELIEPLWLGQVVPFAERFAVAVQTLSVNYRLDGPLTTALGLLDDDCATEVLECAADGPFILWATRKASGEHVPDFFEGPALPAD